MFDYQSECHCTKTEAEIQLHFESLITSQNVTAPKPPFDLLDLDKGLITSQNVTAPKPAFHETIHGIDAKKSAEMPAFKRIHDGTEYNLYSTKVLKDARKAVGLSRFSKKYENAVIELMGHDLLRYRRDGKSPFEIVAYALDFEAQGHSNVLSKAISERF